MAQYGSTQLYDITTLMQRFLPAFPKQPVAYLLADREFVGGERFAFLREKKIPFCIRLKANVRVAR